MIATLTLLACTELPIDAPAPVAPDQAELQVHRFDVEDPSRAVPAIGADPGSPTRTYEVWAWVGPSDGASAGARPLLVMGHGVDGHPESFDAFATHLAMEGVVVVAPVFPRSSSGNDDALVAGVLDLANQPGDLSFVLDWALAAVDEPEHPLMGRFDPARLGVLGHSLGGATVYGLTRFPDVLDTRFGAVVLVAPATFLATDTFGEGPLLDGAPTLLVHGVDDPGIPLSLSEDLRDTLSPTWLLELPGTGHSEMLQSTEEPPVPARDATQRAVLAHLRDALLGETGARDAELTALDAEGFPTR